MSFGVENIGRMLNDVDLEEKRRLAGVFVSENKRDYGGAVDGEGRIVSNSDLIKAFGDLTRQFGEWILDGCSIDDLADLVYNYKAVTNCFDGDTSCMDNYINKFLGGYSDILPTGFPRV
jgi:hypothetical protein